MKRDEVRNKLINSAILVIARDGLDKATTKQISHEISINEAYIYRCFADKEQLFAQSFAMLDDELVDVVDKGLAFMYDASLDFETRCRRYFFMTWDFLLGNRDKCVTFVRYYYSPYFLKHSAQDHLQRYKPIISKFKPAFKAEADVWMILNFILNVLLDFAVKVHNDQMSKEDDYAEHVFRVIYASVKQYFENSEGESVGA